MATMMAVGPDPNMPDLSHLSAEERAIIEQVLQRQRAEEQKEEEISQIADKELEVIEKQIAERKENAQRLVGTQDDAICQICQRTKFADGIGHKCFYCQLRSCARCGGKTTSRSKSIWACSMCQKRQQILARTGKWFQNAGGGDALAATTNSAGGATSGADLPEGPTPSASNQSFGATAQQKKDDRQQHQQQKRQQPQVQQQQMEKAGQRRKSEAQSRLPAAAATTPRRQSSLVKQPSVETSRRRPSQHGHETLPNGISDTVGTKRLPSAVGNRPTDETADERQRRADDRDRDWFQTSYDHSNNEVQPARASGGGQRSQQASVDASLPSSSRSQTESGELPRRAREKTERHKASSTVFDDAAPPPRSAAPCISNTVQKFSPNVVQSSRRTKLPRQLRSLSSSEDEASATVGGPPTAGAAPRREKQLTQRSHRQQMAPQQQQQVLPVSSSLQNTSAQDADFSEKDLLRYIYGSQKLSRKSKSASLSHFDVPPMTASSVATVVSQPSRAVCPIVAGNLLTSRIRSYLSQPVSWQPSADQRRLIEHMVLRRAAGDGGNAAVSCGAEDFGLKLVGGRYSPAGAALGTFIVAVRPGSLADTVGGLRPGDEILEWNGRVMQHLDHEEVCRIVSASRAYSQLELIVARSVHRPGGDDFLGVGPLAYPWTVAPAPLTAYAPLPRIPHAQLPHSQSLVGEPVFAAPGAPRQFCASLPPPLSSPPPPTAIGSFPPYLYTPRRSASPLVFHPTLSSGYEGTLQQSNHGQLPYLCGKIEMSLLYTPQSCQLTVTLHGARELPARADGAGRNAYAKLFLLPDRSERSRRKSATVAGQLAPVWAETFVYEDVPEPALVSRVLEITVWDYDKYEANAFLGETLVDLSEAALDGQPLTYALFDADDEHPIRLRLRQRRYSSQTPPTRGRTHTAATAVGAGSLRPFSVASSLAAGLKGYDIAFDGSGGEYTGSLQNLPYHPPTGMVFGGENGGERDWNRNDGSDGSAAGYLSDYGNGGRADGGASKILYRGADNLLHLHRRPQFATALRNLSELADGRDYGNDLYSQNKDNKQQPQQQQKTRREFERIQREAATGYGSDASDGTLSVNSAQSASQRANYRSSGPAAQQYRYPASTLQQQQILYQNSSGETAAGTSYYGNGSYGSEERTTATHYYGSEFSEDPQDLQNSDNNNNGSDPYLNNNNNSDNSLTSGGPLAGGGVAGGVGGMPFMASGKSATMLLAKRKKSLITRFIPGRNGPTDGKRMGFARSEEVGVSEALSVPDQLSNAGQTDPASEPGVNNITKQASKESTDSSENWLPVTTDKPLGNFVENLGPGQVVGRQCLASPIFGEIQLGLSFDPANGIVLDVLRARNLVTRQAAKTAPTPYVKAYLMDGKNCVAKAKTQTVRKSNAPVIQQRLAFPANPRGKMLQVSILGDYGRMERKSFMGIAQINLDELNLQQQPQQIVGWYKLFHGSSLAGGSSMGPPPAGGGVVRKDSESSMKYAVQQPQQ